jgi:hypothetical protein
MLDKQTVIFLLDSGACFSVLPFSPGPRSKNKIVIWGISGQPLECYFTWPLACSWGNLHFCHSFLVVPETPIPLLGRDLLSQLKIQILLLPREYFCFPLIEEQVDPTVWADGTTNCQLSKNCSSYTNKAKHPPPVPPSKSISPKA